MELRIFTEPQQGATYDDLLGRRPGGRAARLRRVLPLRPLPRRWATRRAARAHRRVGHAGRPGPRDQHDPARHAGDRGDLPASRPARDQRGAGRPDERRPGRARHRRRLVRGGARGVRHPVPRHRRAVRPARGAARHHHRAVGDADGRDFSYDGEALPGRRLARRCRSRCSAKPPVHRSAAAARSGRPHWPRGTPTSSTCRSSTIERQRPQFDAGARGVRGDRARSRRRSSTPTRSCSASARTRRRSPGGPRPSAATPDELRENGLAGTPHEVVDKIGRYAELGSPAALPADARPARPRPPPPGGG